MVCAVVDGAARAKGIYEKAAKERQKTSTGGISPQLVANLPEADKGRSRDQAAKAFGVGGRSVDYASKIPVGVKVPILFQPRIMTDKHSYDRPSVMA